MIKKTIVTSACTLIALLTFAQPGPQGTKTTTEPITVTGTVIPSAIEDGAGGVGGEQVDKLGRNVGRRRDGLSNGSAGLRLARMGADVVNDVQDILGDDLIVAVHVGVRRCGRVAAEYGAGTIGVDVIDNGQHIASGDKTVGKGPRRSRHIETVACS